MEGDGLRLGTGGVLVVGKLPSRNALSVTRHERQVARYEVGHRYQVYLVPGQVPADPTPDAGSPLTRPYVEQNRTLDPTGTFKP